MRRQKHFGLKLCSVPILLRRDGHCILHKKKIPLRISFFVYEIAKFSFKLFYFLVSKA